MATSLTAIVLAAGAGKRMRSATSKVLFEIAGRPLLAYPLLALHGLEVSQVIVVASPTNQDAIKSALTTALPRRPNDASGATEYAVAIQPEPRGTGDAVRVAIDQVTAEFTLILYGDTPLLERADLQALLDAQLDAQLNTRGDAGLILLSARPKDPTGYGRVLRDAAGNVTGVREDRDLSPAERATQHEVNAGVYLVRSELLRAGLQTLKPQNAQGEYYLTDIVEYCAGKGRVIGVERGSATLLGVNDRADLARVARRLFRRIAERHRKNGVSVGAGALIDDTVTLEPDVEIGAHAVLRGACTVAEGAYIETGCIVTDSDIEKEAYIDKGCVVTDSTIGAGADLKPYSVVTDSEVGPEAQVGPFAHLRPDSRIERAARVGNFVEIKATRLGAGAKANHLAYLGDADIGEGANIGAGTIVCNYDGTTKWKTVVGKNAFIGSDSQLIAPVTVGDGAYVATGTTLTQDVPEESLALSRTPQVNKPGYAPKLRARIKERADAKKKSEAH